MENGYLSAGEFAKLCGVDKQTLFYYEKIGLFKPDLRDDENNYRYYSINSFELFFFIRALKEIGVPLSRIKSYMEVKSPEKLVDILNKQLEVVNDSITHLEYIRNFAENKIEQTEISPAFDEFTVEHQDEIKIFRTDVEGGFDGEEYPRYARKHMDNCKSAGLNHVFGINVIYDLDDIKHGYYKRIRSLFTVLNKNQKRQANSAIPSGDYLTTYFKGDWSNIDPVYKGLFDFASQKHHTLIGDFYETTVLDDLSVKGSENYVYKISIMIK